MSCLMKCQKLMEGWHMESTTYQERVIPHIDDIKPADAADAFLFLKMH